MSPRKPQSPRSDSLPGVAASVGGKYVKGRFLESDHVVVARGEWTVRVDSEYLPSTKTTFTRLRAEFVSLDGLRFKLYPRGAFSGIATALGMQDVEVGDAGFDHSFVIKGNDETKLRALLSHRRLRALIAAEPHVVLALRDVDRTSSRGYVPDDAVELHCALPGEIREAGRLKALLDMMAEMLRRLRATGSASAAGLCRKCGYDLRGNVSGTCPECGEGLPDRPARQKQGPQRRGRATGARGRGSRRRGKH